MHRLKFNILLIITKGVKGMHNIDFKKPGSHQIEFKPYLLIHNKNP